MLNDEGSVKGKGASIMLPSRGSPFAPDQPPPPPEAFPPGAETTPRDLSPEDVAMMYSGPVTAEPEGALAGPESVSSAAPPPDLVSAPGGADAALVSAPAGEAVLSAEEQAALEPSSHADRMGGETEGAGSLPPGAQPMPGVPAVAPGMAIPATTVVGGQALPGLRAFGGAGPLQISEAVGITPEAYQPKGALKGKAELISMLVPDGRLVTLWTEIDAVEAQVTTTSGVSRKLARELLDRLTVARNYLLNDRDNFEDADREVAEAKYLLARIRGSHPVQYPRVIVVYLLICITLVVIGFVSTVPLAAAVGNRIAIKGFDFSVVWQAILWGGVGGITGALYGLWTHVARDCDYDPQYALWYYTNPLMGVILGAFVYLLMQAGLPAVVTGVESGSVQPSPFVLYFLAWAVGFQQNLAFSLANSILKKLIPPEEKGPPLAESPSKGAGGKTSEVTLPEPK